MRRNFVFTPKNDEARPSSESLLTKVSGCFPHVPGIVMRILKMFSSFRGGARCQRIPQRDKINTLILSVASGRGGLSPRGAEPKQAKLKRISISLFSFFFFSNNAANWLLFLQTRTYFFQWPSEPAVIAVCVGKRRGGGGVEGGGDLLRCVQCTRFPDLG